MNILDTFKAVSLTTALSLAIASPALAQPAGDEYVPQIPTATGNQPTDQAAGLGNPSTSAAATKSGQKESAKKKDSAGKGTDKKLPVAAASSGSGDGGDSSGGVLDTLLDPIVLLLVAGVLAIAIGMTLARRQGSGGAEVPRSPRPGSAAPPTPHGEIIGEDGPRS